MSVASSDDDQAFRKLSLGNVEMDIILDKGSNSKLMTKKTNTTSFMNYDSAGSTQYMSGMDTAKQK